MFPAVLSFPSPDELEPFIILDNASDVDFEGFGACLTMGFGVIIFSVFFVWEITGVSVVSCVKTFSTCETVLTGIAFAVGTDKSLDW
ncbi:MAG: hypothetical protein C0412_08440 [Flavobacterium sp.]|nr:hypothetical protein [Flavobacterium sp.]